MLCRTCRHCGLCEGDGISEETGLIVKSDERNIPQDERASSRDAGIAVDIGTTTVAASCYHLKTGRFLCSAGEANLQRRWGSDVISRIQHWAEGGGSDLTSSVRNQVSSLCTSLYEKLVPFFLSKRYGRLQVKKVVITGNTAMLSIFAGEDVSGLACYPFTVPSFFGNEKNAPDFLDAECLKDASVFLSPCASAFIGGDAVCAIISSFTFGNRTELLCDAGTNCEMALYNPLTKQITCTSSAAGPAFEGCRIKMGMTASDGAIARVSLDSFRKFSCTVIGKGRARGICGAGLISAVSCFLNEGIIDSRGTFTESSFVKNDEVTLCDGVCLNQNDIREFQLAKSAVRTGLDFLSFGTDLNDSVLYLCGGFGCGIEPSEAAGTLMFPEEVKNVVYASNAALHGAALLFDEDKKKRAVETARRIKTINLADEPSFEEAFIRNLNF